MDCLEGLKLLSDNSVDLVVTSPPYNMRTRIRNGEYTTREKSEHFSKKYEHFSDDLTIEEYYDFHKNVLTELLRVSKCVLWNYQIVTGSKEAVFKLIGDFSDKIKDIIKNHPELFNIPKYLEPNTVLDGEEYSFIFSENFLR